MDGHTALFKTITNKDLLLSSTGALLVLYGSLDGRGAWGRMDTCVCGWVPSLSAWNHHNIVGWLYPLDRGAWLLSTGSRKNWTQLSATTTACSSINWEVKETLASVLTRPSAAAGTAFVSVPLSGLGSALLPWIWSSQALTWPAALSCRSLTSGGGLSPPHRAAASRGPGRRPCRSPRWRTAQLVPARRGCPGRLSCYSVPKLQFLQKVKSVVCKEPLCCGSVAQSCPTLRPRGLRHTTFPCPSLSPGVCSNSRPLSQWC